MPKDRQRPSISYRSVLSLPRRRSRDTPNFGLLAAPGVWGSSTRRDMTLRNARLAWGGTLDFILNATKRAGMITSADLSAYANDRPFL